MNNDKILKDFLAKDKAAELGGGTRKIEKQHQAGRMTARERIETLLDKGTFVEFDKFVTHRCTNYHMQQEKIPGDGIVSGYGKVDGRPVYVYAYDFTVFGGSLSLTNAGKIVKVQTMALKNGAPIIALNDSGGARIQEGVDSLTGYANIFFQNTIGRHPSDLSDPGPLRRRRMLLAGADRLYFHGERKKPHVRHGPRRSESRHP